MDREREQDQPRQEPQQAGSDALSRRRALGRDRLREVILGVPPRELEGTRDYTRYQRLLPQMLAGMLEEHSSEYQWFMAFIDRWDACFAEYQDLRQALGDD
jgi:hypothetical protein